MTDLERFLGSEIPALPREQARFHIIPVPWEKTVSYGAGTANGPEAILNASQQLELWDGIGEPGIEAGIFTCPPADCTQDETVMFASAIREIKQTLQSGNIPVVLGGEHTVSYAPLKAIRDFYPDERIGIVHFDAHCDLRYDYEGSRWSHASVMARALELEFDLFQIGTRAYCKEEAMTRQVHNISFIDGFDLSDERIRTFDLPADFPEKIYISFDVDGLDSAVMPATGTPVPGGLSWFQAIEALKRTVRGRTVVGMDVVELAPIHHLPFADFTAAQLCYRMIGIAWRNLNGEMKL